MRKTLAIALLFLLCYFFAFLNLTAVCFPPKLAAVVECVRALAFVGVRERERENFFAQVDSGVFSSA